jgi:ubiquinone biosynthesis protein UbiJ
MLPSTFSSAINHLLTHEPWAREQLIRHAGKIACLDAGLVVIRLKIEADGMLRSAPPGEQANVTIRIRVSDLPLIMQDSRRAFSYVRVEGDADLADTISQLSQALRWEAEDDLSPWVGEIAASRLVAGARATFDKFKSTRRALSENVAEYFLDENPILMRPQAISDFSGDVTKLRDDLERLTKRIEKLK